jgi:hypothetical protein
MTRIGGRACYPVGGDRESADFCLFVNIEGGAGKAYVDRSKKTVHLEVVSGRKEVALERDYTAEAGDLRWLATWPGRSRLEVVFFEYEKPAAPKQIFSLAFTWDESKKRFSEAAAPAAVLQEDAKSNERENKRTNVDLYFADSAQNEARILQAMEQLSAQDHLQKKPPLPGIIGRIAEWSAADLSIDVQRYDSLHQIAIELEDYGRPELSEEIATKLRLLPAIAGTRRIRPVNFRTVPQELDHWIGVVEAVAKQYGLHRIGPRRIYDVASFEAPDLRISVSFFESDGRVDVSIEDTGWHAEFAEIERALRSGLTGNGRQE